MPACTGLTLPSAAQAQMTAQCRARQQAVTSAAHLTPAVFAPAGPDQIRRAGLHSFASASSAPHSGHSNSSQSSCRRSGGSNRSSSRSSTASLASATSSRSSHNSCSCSATACSSSSKSSVTSHSLSSSGAYSTQSPTIRSSRRRTDAHQPSSSSRVGRQQPMGAPRAYPRAALNPGSLDTSVGSSGRDLRDLKGLDSAPKALSFGSDGSADEPLVPFPSGASAELEGPATASVSAGLEGVSEGLDGGTGSGTPQAALAGRDSAGNLGIATGTSSGPLALLRIQVPDWPDRYWIVAKTSLAFVLANMDKVNLSVAIIPLSHQYAWSASTAGLVQSSFFWGYALSLVPAGWLATKFTGQRVLKGGVVMWSLATAAVPFCANALPLLLLSRVLVGFGEGVAPPAATDLVARLMPASERTRAVAAVFNGFNVGSILGLLAAPILIENFGWESVFYFFGAAGLLWSISFNPNAVPREGLPTEDGEPTGRLTPLTPQLAGASVGAPAPNGVKEGGLTLSTGAGKGVEAAGGAGEGEGEEKVPWGAILKRPAVWAVVYIHFCQNWGHFCLLAWLPTFYNEGLHLELSQAALVSMVPPILSLGVSAWAAPLADKFVQRGTDVTLVRKVAQGTAFVVPTLCMGLVAYAAELSIPPWMVIVFLSLGLGFSSCAYAGLYCAHQDMSKKYASILLGLSTTVGAVPGIIGVPLTGVLFDLTHSWMASLFLPSILFYISGALVWGLYADCRPQHFEQEGKALL